MQQAVRDVNFPQSDVRVGNTAPADREEADGWAAASNHACQDTSAVVGKASPRPSDSVRPGGAARRLGKTYRMAVQGGGEVDVAARAVGKHPLPIPPSLDWFALFRLCQLGRAEGACVSLVGGHQSRLVLKPDGRVQTDDRVQRTPMDREQTEWI